MSESTDKLEAQISEINDGLEAAIKGMHRATIRNESADNVEAQIEDIYRERARVAVAQAKLDSFDAAEANAAPVEPRPEYPEQTKARQMGPEDVFEWALPIGFLGLLFWIGVAAKTLICGLIGAGLGYARYNRVHESDQREARLNKTWDPETGPYPRNRGAVFALMFIGLLIGIGVVELFSR